MENNKLFASEEKYTFTEKINKVLQTPLLQGSLVGLSVRSADNGQIIYDYQGNTRLKPASNAKLLTAAVALEQLGEKYTFHTKLLTDGKIKGHTLQGNLYIKGEGDPTLLQTDIQHMVSSLKKKGIKHIEGNIYTDDSWFDNERSSIDLAWSDETEYYGAQISALTLSPNRDYDAGTVIVDVLPNTKGDSATVTVSPANNYVKIINDTKMSDKKGTPKEIKVVREHGTNNIHVTGTLTPTSESHRSWVAVWEPTDFVGSVLKQALIENQLVAKNVQVKRKKTSDHATVLLIHCSDQLKNILVPFMKFSNNTIAETLVKEIGKVKNSKGSWEKGLAEMNRTLPKFGIDANQILLRDGSGMSPVDLISPNQLSNLLYYVQSEPWFETYKHALPIAGNENRSQGGTLRNRMKHTAAANNVIAKTGSISSVSTLSGYVTTKDKHLLTFSMMFNNFVDVDDAADEVKLIEDQLATLIANTSLDALNK